MYDAWPHFVDRLPEIQIEARVPAVSSSNYADLDPRVSQHLRVVPPIDSPHHGLPRFRKVAAQQTQLSFTAPPTEIVGDHKDASLDGLLQL